jgi:uncharacterized protein (DUF486 family)
MICAWFAHLKEMNNEPWMAAALTSCCIAPSDLAEPLNVPLERVMAQAGKSS